MCVGCGCVSGVVFVWCWCMQGVCLEGVGDVCRMSMWGGGGYMLLL